MLRVYQSSLAAAAAAVCLFHGSAAAQANWKLASAAQPGSVLIPEAALLNMPDLWRSDAERDFVTDNHALPVLKKVYDAKGLVIIGLGEVGWNDVVCKKACLTPDSVKGMKVRVSPAAQSTPHYVMTRHLHHGSTFMVNKKSWEALAPAQREIVANARPSIEKMRHEVAADEKPKMEDFKKKGGFVHELSADQRAAWARLVEPNQEQMVKEIGAGAQELWDAIKQGKAAFAARK